LEELTAPPSPLAVFKGPTSKEGRGETAGEERRKETVTEREGKRRGGESVRREGALKYFGLSTVPATCFLVYFSEC